MSEQLKALAEEGVDTFLADLKDLVKDHDLPRVKEFAQEIAELQLEVLQTESAEDKDLLKELMESKLGTMAHVLDIERIVVSREIANMVCNGLKTFLKGFSVVAKELIKVSIRTAVGGVAGSIMGSAGEKLAEKALEAIGGQTDKLIDKGVEKAGESLDDWSDDLIG